MRKFEISPAIAAAMRSRALAQRHREVQVPLYLHAPDGLRAPARDFVEYDAEDARVEAGGVTVGADEDDDFY
jgi:hypothetical protein